MALHHNPAQHVRGGIFQTAGGPCSGKRACARKAWAGVARAGEAYTGEAWAGEAWAGVARVDLGGAVRHEQGASAPQPSGVFQGDTTNIV